MKQSTRKLLAEFKRLGFKIEKGISIQKPSQKCASKRCNGQIFGSVVSFTSSLAGPPKCGIVVSMGIAHPCNKCGRMHNLDGSPLESINEGEKVFLDQKTGEGVVKKKNGKEVFRFWTSATKPSRGDGRIRRAKC